MQTPKGRASSSEVSRKLSPRSSSVDVPNKTSPRVVSSEGSQKVSSKVIRQLKTTTSTSDSVTPPNRACRVSRVAELESQISQLQGELEKLKDQLSASELTRKQAEEDADESRKSEADAKFEVGQLRSALEAAEIRFSVEMRNANELVEEIKSISSIRENELEAELKKSKSEMENLKSNMLDKESEFQEKYELEKKLEKSLSDIENLKANLMDKEAQLKNLSHDDIDTESEALVKVGYMKEEIDKSNKKASRAAEQLEAAQAAKAELEADLRRLKVQAHQWQKAAEAAAAMLSSENNGKHVERTGSMDIHYSPGIGKVGFPPYMEDVEGDYVKRKNSNVFKKIGVLWKKPQK